MTPDQIEIGEKLLQLLLSKTGYRADRDVVSNTLTEDIEDSSKQVLKWIEVQTAIRFLSHYKVLNWETSEENWLVLGINGLKASEKGLRNFIDEFEERSNSGTTNIIKGNITGSQVSQSGSSSGINLSNIQEEKTYPKTPAKATKTPLKNILKWIGLVLAAVVASYIAHIMKWV